MMKHIGIKAVGWLLGFAVLILRLTCRHRHHSDPRSKLAKSGTHRVFGALHAMQLAGSMAAVRGVGTMVSRSIDGEILIPGLKLRGIVPIRGSGGRQSKGGATALHRLIQHAQTGEPVMIAIDGPRGPRGVVKKGIALLAQKSDAVIVPVVAIPQRRWVFSRTWDRIQIPKPFSVINYYYADPIVPESGESLESLADRTEQALHRLEKEHDPQEAKFLVRRSDLSQPDRRRQAA